MLDPRFRRVWDLRHLPAIDAFDPGNDLHLDELAFHLLERFRRYGDAEAFALLFEVTGRRLEQVALRLAARLRPACAPQDLIEGLKLALWRGRGALLPGSFLSAARGLMEQQARQRCRDRSLPPLLPA